MFLFRAQIGLVAD